jgi:3-oxoacyl-[acyl-carrier protein] reductase
VKQALVTGGSRGLGLAICQRLLAEGWSVTTTARHPSPEISATAARYPDRFRFVATDLSAPDGVTTLAHQALVLEGFDGFVANAAVGTDGLLTLLPESAIRNCIELNLLANILLAREVIKGMLARGSGGSLVFVSSVAARTGLSGLSVYGASKAALAAFSRALAREYGPRAIRSNCVVPGFLETDMSAPLPPAHRSTLARRTPLGRLGHPDDVVGAVSFLLGPDAAHVSGTEIVVDGGMTA